MSQTLWRENLPPSCCLAILPPNLPTYPWGPRGPKPPLTSICTPIPAILPPNISQFVTTPPSHSTRHRPINVTIHITVSSWLFQANTNLQHGVFTQRHIRDTSGSINIIGTHGKRLPRPRVSFLSYYCWVLRWLVLSVQRKFAIFVWSAIIEHYQLQSPSERH